MKGRGPFAAIASRPILVGFFVVIGIAAGVAAGIVRDPSYSAQSRLQVSLNAASPAGLQGSLPTGIDFASTYARVIEAPEIVRPVSRKAGISDDAVRAQLTATPIPDTAVIDVDAEADTPDEAAAIADAAADALIAYSEEEPESGSNPSSEELLEQFEDAAREAEGFRLDEDEARDELGNGNDPDERQTVVDASVAAQTAEARRDAAQTAYIASQSVFSAPLRIVTPALDADSDRSSTLQILGVLGAIVGFVLGSAIALAAGPRRRRDAEA